MKSDKWTMPLLYGVYQKALEDGVDLSSVYLIACQHVLLSNFFYFELLYKLGLKPENTFVLGKAYSTSSEVLNFWRETGAHLSEKSLKYDPSLPWQTQFEETIVNFLNDDVIPFLNSTITNYIILDDGGLLISNIQKNSYFFGKHLTGIEQTSSGFRLLENKLTMPVVNVARSDQKLQIESPRIAEYCLTEALKRLPALNNMGIKIIILGNGYIARSLQSTCLEQGFISETFETLGVSSEDIESYVIAYKPNLVFGTTGEKILDIKNLIGKLKTDTVFISCSSGDKEFLAWNFRNLANHNKNPHHDYKIENITLLNAGFPINFNGEQQLIPLEKIDLTEALLFSAVLTAQSVNPTNPQFVEIDNKYLRQIQNLGHS